MNNGDPNTQVNGRFLSQKVKVTQLKFKYKVTATRVTWDEVVYINIDYIILLYSSMVRVHHKIHVYRTYESFKNNVYAYLLTTIHHPYSRTFRSANYLLGVDNDLYNKLLFMFVSLLGILQRNSSVWSAYCTVSVVIKMTAYLSPTNDKINVVYNLR